MVPSEHTVWVMFQGSGCQRWFTCGIFTVNTLYVRFCGCICVCVGFPGSSAVKNLPATGDLGSVPGSGRSPGGGHGNPLQYSCLENPVDRGAWQDQSIGSQRVGHDWSNLAHTHAYACVPTWWEELTHCQRPWCWKRLMAKGERGSRG